MSDESEIKLNDLMFMALDHGFDSIADGSGPLIPFAVLEDASGLRQLRRFVTDRLEDGVEAAKMAVDAATADVLRYAIAWDGYITMQDRKWDAIFVEAGDRVQSEALLLCQRYQAVEGSPSNQTFGNPALVSNPPSRLRS